MVNAQGQEMRSISLRDPAAIKLSIDNSKNKDIPPEDRMIDLFAECVVPLLLDLRTLMLEVFIPTLRAMQDQNNVHSQLLHKISEERKIVAASTLIRSP
jgi:hypothetical protein